MSNFHFKLCFLAAAISVSATLVSARAQEPIGKQNLNLDLPLHKNKEVHPNEQDQDYEPGQFRDRQYHPHLKAHSQKQPQPHTGVDWWQRGQDELNVALNKWPKWKPARNVIYFIGDGMGVSTLTSARHMNAHRQGKSFTEGSLSWETFPSSGVVSTYNTDQQVPDSAGSATAFACGERARDGVIGVNENVLLGNCSLVAGNELRSIVHYAQDEGKWAGIVTNTRITHATPAAAYAHSADRGWEVDGDIPEEGQGICDDIAKQLIESVDNQKLRVIMGGGRTNFFPTTTDDAEYPNRRGQRTDGRDLRQEWLAHKAGLGLAADEYHYVENKTAFDSIDIAKTKYLFGLFETSHMKFEVERREEPADSWDEPSLSEMVKKSLDILKKQPNGYILYVEGGRIDQAHHDNHPHLSLTEVLALQEAVEVAMNETDEEDTLILVTADHSHAFTMGGYVKLDNDILAITVDADDVTVLAEDDKPYTTLMYGGGPGYLTHRADGLSYKTEQPRKNLTNEDTTERRYEFDAPLPFGSNKHGGEDVVVYARGPMAHLFEGQHEQHYIAHAAMYASCVGWNRDLCVSNPPPPGTCP